VHAPEIEQATDLPDHVFGTIEDLGVRGEHCRGIAGERAVDVDGNGRDSVRPRERVQVVQQLLGPAQRERRDENATAARGRVPDDLAQALAHVLDRRMLAVAVRRFHDHEVRRDLRRLRIPDDGLPPPAHVSGEHDAARRWTLGALENHGGGAENVAGVDEAGANARTGIEGGVIRHSDHLPRHLRHVTRAVQRLHRLASTAPEELGVLLLDVRGIHEHDGAEVPRRRRRPDRVRKAALHQERQPSAVVDVCVREDCRSQRRRRK
jgi:hypothetical protein